MSRRDSTNSNESSIEIFSHSDSSDVFDSGHWDTTGDVEVLDNAPVAQKKNVEDYVLVKIISVKNTFRHFIGGITDEQDEDGDCEVKFMKALWKIRNSFLFQRG